MQSPISLENTRKIIARLDDIVAHLNRLVIRLDHLAELISQRRPTEQGRVEPARLRPPLAEQPPAQPERPTPQPGAAERYLSVREVAAYLGISQRTVWRLHQEGAFPHPVYIGKKLARWPLSAVARFAQTSQP